MKKVEKYIDMLFGEDVEYSNCVVCQLRLGYNPCSLNSALTLKECKEHCEQNKKWLLEEYIEIPKLTRSEKVILGSIDKQLKWIARDGRSNEILYLYMEKPEKSYPNSHWTTGNYYKSFQMFNHLFQFIKWEDDEPYLIEELLNWSEEAEDESND